MSCIGHVGMRTHCQASGTLALLSLGMPCIGHFGIRTRCQALGILASYMESRASRSDSDMMMVPSIASLRSKSVARTVEMTRWIRSISCFRKIFIGCRCPATTANHDTPSAVYTLLHAVPSDDHFGQVWFRTGCKQTLPCIVFARQKLRFWNNISDGVASGFESDFHNVAMAAKSKSLQTPCSLSSEQSLSPSELCSIT